MRVRGNHNAAEHVCFLDRYEQLLKVCEHTPSQARVGEAFGKREHRNGIMTLEFHLTVPADKARAAGAFRPCSNTAEACPKWSEGMAVPGSNVYRNRK